MSQGGKLCGQGHKGKSTTLGIRRMGLCLSAVATGWVCPWATHLISQSSSFVILKMGLICAHPTIFWSIMRPHMWKCHENGKILYKNIQMYRLYKYTWYTNITEFPRDPFYKIHSKSLWQLIKQLLKTFFCPFHSSQISVVHKDNCE